MSVAIDKPSQTDNLKIDHEFQNLIPPLMSEEINQLKLSILKEGCRDPLVIWKEHKILLDGHNRYAICIENGIIYTTIEIELPDRVAAISWIINNQLGRRNLTSEAISYLRGKLYNHLKLSKSNPQGKNQHTKNKGFEVSYQNDNQPKTIDAEVSYQNDNQPKTIDVVAERFKVSSATISRDGRYATAVDILATVAGDEIRRSILCRNTKLSKKLTESLAQLAKQNPDQVKEKLTGNNHTILGSLPLSDFPYKIGEVCRVIKADNEPKLRGFGGCWAIVTKVYNYCCDVALWNGTAEMIKPEHLISLEFTASQQEERKELCERFHRLLKCPLEPTAQSILSMLGREKQPSLTSFQEKLLSFIENEYGIK